MRSRILFDPPNKMAEIRYKCNTAVDNEFGPAVACNEFDFTLAFEQTIFLIGTSGIFIIASLFRLTTLYKESIKVNGLLYLYGCKIVCANLCRIVIATTC